MLLSIQAVGVAVSDSRCCLLPSDGGCCYQYRLLEFPCPIVCVGCCPLMVGAVVNTGGRGVAHLPVWCECRCPMVGAACCPLMVGVQSSLPAVEVPASVACLPDGGCCCQYRVFECRCPMVGVLSLLPAVGVLHICLYCGSSCVR